MLDMRDKAHRAFTGLKAGEKDFVDRDRRQAGESNAHGVMMENRDAKQGYPKQDEIDRNAKDHRISRRHRDCVCVHTRNARVAISGAGSLGGDSGWRAVASTNEAIESAPRNQIL